MTEYFKRSTAEVQKFVKGLSEAASDNEQHVFDSAAGAELSKPTSRPMRALPSPTRLQLFSMKPRTMPSATS